jgi:GTPase Era involved in 16S rRNA processing
MTLAELGCTLERSLNSNNIEINGLTVGGSETTTLKVTLPRAPAVQASFSKEGVGKKIVKLFKKELQTGDAHFDNRIYISTDTAEATQAFLAAEAVREVIADCVLTGGPIEIDGAVLKMVVLGHISGEPREAVALAQALLG